MGTLDDIEPKKVFRFFEEITQIPHGSCNLQAISDYLMAFAKDRKLEAEQDESLNVIIRCPASKGYEDHKPLIIQGHMDMVAVAEPQSGIDMKTASLKVMTDGEYIWADETSLGGDDGIAVAMCLAIMDSDDIKHPPLEAVFTTDEEIGMIGATNLDCSKLKGRTLLNLDTEEEGVLLTSCAGGGTFHGYLPVDRIERSGKKVEIVIDGLLGGHSGDEIDKEHGNADHIMGRLMMELFSEISFSIVDMEGGLADNAIPKFCRAQIVIDSDSDDSMKKLDIAITKFQNMLGKELEMKDPGLTISCKETGMGTFDCVDEASAKKMISYICIIPDGIQAMSFAIKGLPETSLNLGILRMNHDRMEVALAVRSSVASSKEYLIKRLEMISDLFGARHELTGAYPAWEYQKDSRLRSLMTSVYKKMYGKDMKIAAIHAGVELGIFSSRIPGLDCVSIGPDMKDIHTTHERLSVASTARSYDFVKAVLEQC